MQCYGLRNVAVVAEQIAPLHMHNSNNNIKKYLQQLILQGFNFDEFRFCEFPCNLGHLVLIR